LKELLKTNDPVRLSWARSLLREEGIETYVLDTHMSVLEGSAGAIPRRLMVADEDYPDAHALIEGAEASLNTNDPAAAGAEDEEMPVTEDGFLGGKVRLRQPEKGYRAAIDPVLLAAAVPAEGGERALDIGAGVGTAGLLLAWRVAGLRVTGMEIDPAMLRLASENARLNNLDDRVEFMVGDLSRPPARLAPGSFDHVLANPPYLEADRATASSEASRAGARIEGRAGASGAGLDAWVRFGCVMVRDRGTITMIHRADRLDDLLAILRGRAGGITVFPLWPDRSSKPASRVLVQAVKGSKAPMRLAQGLVLHEDDGRYTVEAEAVLRHGAPLPLQGRRG
jgi:tRNA1(Val) A37 N6-methylase TrmN6